MLIQIEISTYRNASHPAATERQDSPCTQQAHHHLENLLLLLLLSQQRDDVVQVGDGSSVSPDLGDKEKQVERMGLTPDWIIQVTAFKVFQLSPPTPEQPFIKGLLDPCTNSMLAPNIPAEKLYDKVVGALCC